MDLIQENNFMVGAAVGSGISALAATTGGADFLLAINAGRLRNMGAPSITCMLPTHNANSLGKNVALNEILPLVSIPVLLGVNCWSSEFDPKTATEEALELGVAGVVNFPSSMHFSYEIRQILDRADMGFSKEVEMLEKAQKLGLKSLCYCGSKNQAELAATHKIEYILYNYGWNAGGTLGHQKRSSLEEAGSIAREVSLAVKKINPNSKFLLEGGPIITDSDLEYVIQYAEIDGYVGGSTLDRLPFETTVANKIAGYRQAGVAKNVSRKSDITTIEWLRKYGFKGEAPSLIKFIQSLRSMQDINHSFAVSVDDGLDVEPILNAIRSEKNKSVLVIDTLVENTPSKVSRLLLGQKLEDKIELGVLADPDLDTIVIQNAQALPIHAQRRLAKAIMSGVIYHPETRRKHTVSSKIVILTNQSLDENRALQGFTTEFASLFKGWTIEYPPLRSRSSDVVELLNSQILKMGVEKENIPIFSPASIQLLIGYSWSGNDVDLVNAAGILLSKEHQGEISQEDTKALLLELASQEVAVSFDVASEKNKVVEYLWRNGFSRTRTAAALGISRKTLYNKLKKYGIN